MKSEFSIHLGEWSNQREHEKNSFWKRRYVKQWYHLPAKNIVSTCTKQCYPIQRLKYTFLCNITTFKTQVKISLNLHCPSCCRTWCTTVLNRIFDTVRLEYYHDCQSGWSGIQEKDLFYLQFPTRWNGCHRDETPSPCSVHTPGHLTKERFQNVYQYTHVLTIHFGLTHDHEIAHKTQFIHQKYLTSPKIHEGKHHSAHLHVIPTMASRRHYCGRKYESVKSSGTQIFFFAILFHIRKCW